MTEALVYDLLLETQGLIRSHNTRVTLDRDLRVGDSLTMCGRDWVVSLVQSSTTKVDRRLIAREVSGGSTTG
jgi:hypothetical protein